MTCQTTIAGYRCVYDEGHTIAHLCRNPRPGIGEETFNGGLKARFDVSCPGSELCGCGSPMRADGTRCTRRRCPVR